MRSLGTMGWRTAFAATVALAPLATAGCLGCDAAFNACALYVHVEVDAAAMGLALGDDVQPTPVVLRVVSSKTEPVDVSCSIDGQGHIVDCVFPEGLAGGLEVTASGFESEANPDEYLELEIRKTGSAAGKTPRDVGMTVLAMGQTFYEDTFKYDWELTDNRGETCQPCAEHFPERQEVQVPSSGA